MESPGGWFFTAITTVMSAGVFPECLKRVLLATDQEGPSIGELVHQFASECSL
jgi:hypothetical protein